MPQVIIPDILPLTQAIAILNQTVYSTDWTANVASDVVVYSRPANTPANDATQILSQTSQYSVAFIGDGQTVQVTLVTPSLAADVVTITRMTPENRLNLYTNTNFTPTMLNNDFGILTLVDQQAQLVNQEIAPRYNYSALIEPIVDTILPILGENEAWVKNSSGTAITTFTVPSSGIAPANATYLTLTDFTAELPMSQPLSASLAGIMINNPNGQEVLTTAVTGTPTQITITNGNGLGGSINVAIATNPIIPGAVGMGIPSGTTGQRIIPGSNINLRYNTTIRAIEYWTGSTWAQLVQDDIVLPGTQNQLAWYATTGTQISGLTLGDYGVLISSSAGAPSWLANGSTGQVLSATASASPSWANISDLGAIITIDGDSGSASPASGVITITGGSTGLTTSGSGSTISLIGLLNSTSGGTGVSAPTAHGIMIGEGASPMTPIVLSSGQILIGSTGVDPVAAAINSGTGILVANGAGSITVGLAAIASHDILSNITGGSAAPIPNTLTATIDAAIGSTQGNILYRNSTVWTVLAPGTAGQVFQTGGAAANPAYSTATYPLTTTINQLLYSSSANTVVGLVTANSSVLITSSGGVPSLSTTLPAGLTIPGYQATITPAALTKTDDTNVTLTLGGTPATALLQATSLTLGWTGTLSVSRGGTGVGSVTISPTATSWAGWDANKNLSANSFIAGYATTATAASTTTLTVGSAQQQFFTGITTQTVLLPVTSTLVLGQSFTVVNNSTGIVTVQSSGGNTVYAMPASTQTMFTCILTSGTTASSWNFEAPIAGSGTVNSGTAGQLAYYATSTNAVSGTNVGTGVLTALAVNIGTAGSFVVNGGALGTPSSANLSNATAYPFVAPTIQKFLSGSGTYTKPTSPAPLYIGVKAVAGGGGGGGGNSGGGGTSGGVGGNTTFGTTLISCTGGTGGVSGANAGSAAGGGASLGSGPIGIALSGGDGNGIPVYAAVTFVSNFIGGGAGGNSIFGGGGACGGAGAGTAGVPNSGGGGAGGSSAASASSSDGAGGGGGAGGGVEAIITSPSSTYAYSVGAAGAAGSAGTGAGAGGLGGAGMIVVTEYYQ